MAKTKSQTETMPSGETDTKTKDAIEQRVVAFAEQLGWFAGTVQAKAEGWLDRDKLSKQVADVRDGATELLERITGGTSKTKQKKAAAPARMNKGRSGGVVDAPGKKHRGPAPADPRAKAADGQQASLRRSASMAKTNSRRGRG